MEKVDKKVLLKARDFILKRIKGTPEIGIILGSGLGAFAGELKNPVIIPYSAIPGFRKSAVKGHANELHYGTIKGKKVIVMKGRYHFYEGYSMFDVTFPMRVLHSIGIKKVIVTNASGSLSKNLKPGSLVILKDHINLSGVNPLLGIPAEFGEKFVDLTNAYSRTLIKTALASAKKLKINLKQGVYVFLSGPTYETPSEIKFLRKAGGSVVGMSTVPEVVTANQLGLEVLGISSVTNLGAGISSGKINHKEVIEINKLISKSFISLLQEIITDL